MGFGGFAAYDWATGEDGGIGVACSIAARAGCIDDIGMAVYKEIKSNETGRRIRHRLSILLSFVSLTGALQAAPKGSGEGALLDGER